MLKKNIIEPSDSRYNSSVWVVPKETTRLRKTEMETYRTYILSELRNAKFFSALDLSSEFHQIPMDPESKKYTAFSTPQGYYHYDRMPFGLKNAQVMFQRMIDTALRGLINKHCFAYLDEVVIFGQPMEERNQNLQYCIAKT
jgi:hypothetical protein